MNKKNKVILIILSIILIELVLIKPLSYDFYNFNNWGKSLTIIGVYGIPIYILLPTFLISMVLLVFKLGKKDYWTKVTSLTKNLYLGLCILILSITSILIFSKFGLGKDMYPLIQYTSIEGTKKDLTDIKVGTFITDNYIIKRDNKTEFIIIKNTNDTLVSDIRWISNYEYEAISRTKNNWLKENKTRIKITNNTPDFYECYIKYGDYGAYEKINNKTIANKPL